MPDEDGLQALITNVQAHRKYAQIEPSLIERLSRVALAKGLAGKAALKDVRSKLHQVGTAYLRRSLNVGSALHELATLPANLDAEPLQQFCLDQMRTHASTAERLPILPTFFHTCLEPILPITSVLDLACGLNPLALPWMPLDGPFTYQACDIFRDLLKLVDGFFDHCQVKGETFSCDLAGTPPATQSQVALLLKTLPCLEQIDKDLALPLLEAVQAEHILVSFPVHSLSGRKKGMPAHYREHFLNLIDDKNWETREFIFATELAFLVTK